MRTDIEHLPSKKQRELERVVQFIFEEFDDALALAKHEWKKRGRIEKILLYGSYARGDWVDEPHTAKGYQSDFDILIIVSDKRLTDRVDYWLKLEDRFNRELAITHGLRTPVNFIVHSLQEVNDGLAHGRYFFIDLRRDGIALYQFDESELHVARPKTPADALEMGREYFEEWFPASMRKFKLSKDAIDQGFTKEAAFLLHQTTESLYHAALLVATFYTPHVHNIGFLRTQAERLDRRLVDAWPRESRFDQIAWERLKEAYVKARYSKHYQISAEQLEWLAKHVEELGAAVHIICTERLSALEAKVSGAA
jgi:predicted nucleotidyltransferase/HEPN domain-containing protein